MDWTKTKRISYEHYEVDVPTWTDKRQMPNVANCKITRDEERDVLYGATMTVGEYVRREIYVRSYLVAEQPVGSGEKTRVCLGTNLVQAPKLNLDGKAAKRAVSAYSPLIELRRGLLPLLYTVPKGSDVVRAAKAICARWCRAPVLPCELSVAMAAPLTADTSDNPLTFLRKVLDVAALELRVDAYGRLSFAPVVPSSAMQPTWVYKDYEQQIMYPDVTEDANWAETPNTLEVVFGGGAVVGHAYNRDESSELSIQARGEVGLREDGPNQTPTQQAADAYAAKRLEELSCDERTCEYEHGYNGVSLGDCVGMDYTKHGYTVTMRVTRQEIDCGSSCCKVHERAKHTVRMWGGL